MVYVLKVLEADDGRRLAGKARKLELGVCSTACTARQTTIAVYAMSLCCLLGFRSAIFELLIVTMSLPLAAGAPSAALAGRQTVTNALLNQKVSTAGRPSSVTRPQQRRHTAGRGLRALESDQQEFYDRDDEGFEDGIDENDVSMRLYLDSADVEVGMQQLFQAVLAVTEG
jgi:hypothetical protein